MPNIASLLKTEISRVARKEIRTEIAALKKASSQHRSTIAALRRELDSVKRQVRASQRARPAPAGGEETGEAEVKRRFSAPRLAKHRQSLGISASDYGKLVGVSGQSIYHWEAGEVRPRPAQIEALASIRGLGKREVAARLEQLSQAPAGKSRRARSRGRR